MPRQLEGSYDAKLIAVDPSGAEATVRAWNFTVVAKPEFTIESIRRTMGTSPGAEYILAPDPDFNYSVNTIYRFGVVDPNASQFNNPAGGAAEQVTYTIEGQLPLLVFG